MATEIPSLTLSEIKALIKIRFKNRHIKTRPLCLVAHTGVGKTQGISQVAAELTEELATELRGQPVRSEILHLEFTEAPDFQGQYYIDDKGLDPVTKHARPELLPKDGYGILLIDEPNRCRKDCRQGMLQLLEEHRANQHRISENWIIVLAMNPVEADGVTYEVDEFDNALEARISKIAVKPDAHGTIDYFIKKYTTAHPVVRWMANNPQVIDFKGQTRTNPRGLEYLVKAIATDNDGKVKAFDNVINFNTVAVEIGLEAAHTFIKFISSETVLRAEDIIDNFTDDLGKQLMAYETAGRTDILNTLITNIVSVISHRTEEQFGATQLRNLGLYQEICSAESKRVFWLALYEALKSQEKFYIKIATYTIKHCPSVVKFLEENDEAIKRG